MSAAALQLFKVRYVDQRGEVHSVSVEARGKLEAEKKVGISSSRILSVSIDLAGTLFGQLKRSRLPLRTQANFLRGVSARISSGDPPSLALDSVVTRMPQFAKYVQEVRTVQLFSDKLQILGFDPHVIIMAKVGETADLGGVLSRGVKDLIKRDALRGELFKAVPSILVAVLGFLIFLILPHFIGPQIESIMKVKGLTFQTNAATDIVLGLNSAERTVGFGAVLIVALAGIGLRVLWTQLKRIPPFRVVDELQRTRRSLDFVLLFWPLYSAGIKTEPALQKMADGTNGAMRESLLGMIHHLNMGGQLATAFERESWSQLLDLAMSGFDRSRDSERAEIMANLAESLESEQRDLITLACRVLNLSALIVSVSAVLMIFLGMTLPLLTATPQIGAGIH